MHKCVHCGTEVFPCTMCPWRCRLYYHPEPHCKDVDYDGYITPNQIAEKEDLPLELSND